MIIYSVTIAIETRIESEWLDWMNRIHIPDVLLTDCFSKCRTYKILDSGGNEPTYVIQYYCQSIEEYYRYRDSFAPALQKDHSDRFAGSFRASRQLLAEIARAEHNTNENA